MITDCHTHIFAANHKSPEYIAEATARARNRPVDLFVPPEQHWQAMQNVSKAIVFGMRALHVGATSTNEYIAAYVQAHPDKLIGFAAIDPMHDAVPETLEHATENLKLRGVKLAPTYQGIHPLDKRLLRLYEYCEARSLPILIHQGTTFLRKAPLKYALPITLEEVALAFPKLKMIIAHLGHPWIDDTIVLIRKQPNFYADISALYYRPWQFYNALISAMEYGTMHKLLFGSDFPFTTPDATVAALKNINHIVAGTNLPLIPMDEIENLISRPTLKLLELE